MKNYDTRDTFPKVGDDEPELVDVSGAPSPNTMPVARPRTVGEANVGGPTSHRSPVLIDARAGEQLDARLGRDLTLAAMRRREIRETVEAGTGSIGQREYEAGLFGFRP